MRYRSVSSYWVFDEIKSGKTIYVLDRKTLVVCSVNGLSVNELIEVMANAEKESSRYEFWYEEEEEKENA